MHPQPKLVAFAAIPAFFCKRKWIDGTRDKESIKEKTAKYKVTTTFAYFGYNKSKQFGRKNDDFDHDLI